MTAGEDGWHRLHPLSPVVRAGRGLVALAVVLLPSLAAGHADYGGAATVGALTVAGVVYWLVTRWRLEGDALRIETGLLRRRSLRYPLAQVQAIDVVRPGVARVFGLSELRLRMGGSTGDHARLAYLPEPEAERLRHRLLALREGAGVEEPRPPARERVLLSVPTPRLVGSLLTSGIGLAVEALALAAVLVAVLAPRTVGAVAGSSFVFVIALLTVFWRRFNDEYRLTVAEAEDGLRLRSGFVALTSETIPRGRVQAVRMVEPLLWRPLGWCRLEVDVAGRQRAKGEGREERRALRAVLPVGSRALALALLARIVPDAPELVEPPPPRARLKSPLRFHNLGWSRTETCAVARGGRVNRVTVWVPLVKVQSLRRVQGPLQRRLRLASVHLDTAGRRLHASLRDRDAAEADGALADLVRLCRAERRRDTASAP